MIGEEKNIDQDRPSRTKRATTITEARPEKIRAELNIEKWPAIWNPTHSKIHSKLRVASRTLERETTGPDGTKTVSQVTINPIPQLGDLTTDDQRTLYALIKHWEERGKPAHETPFSIRQLARLLRKRGWGTNVIDAITGSLERLRGTMLIWTRSYRSRDQRVEDSERVYINLLSKLKIVQRKIDGHVTTEAGYFQFDDQLLRNLLDNYTKPFLFDVFMEIKGEIALKLYGYIDLIMADKTRFERCTKDLFEDLGLKGLSYRNPSKRKQNLEKAIEELKGVILTTGLLKSASIEKTKDGKDYKVVFQKGARASLPFEEAESVSFAEAVPVVINDYSRGKDSALSEAEELVRHFQKFVHGIDKHQPQSKELAQALSLISQYGIEMAKHVVEFAARKADETGFKIQHFGAVLSYASRAMAEFEKRKEHRTAEVHASPMIPPAAPVPAMPRCSRGERRLLALSAEQYAERFERHRQELFRQSPFVARQRGGKDLVEKMVRSRIVRELDSEVMDLVPLSALELPETLLKFLARKGE